MQRLEVSGAVRSSLGVKRLTPQDPYSGRTASLTSKRCILYIYSTNTGTEYFKHGIYCPFFSLQNAVCFIILTYLVPVLFTFYVIIIIIFIAIGLSPGDSGYFTCKQNMKLVTTKFKSGGLHEKHVVATWNVGNHLSICF